MESCGFQPIYSRLIDRWLRNLAKAGVLHNSGERYRPAGELGPVALDAYWRDAERALENDPVTLTYFKRCGDLLKDVLTGRVSPLETLFPDGSFELADALYQQSSEARYSNAIVAEAVRTAVRGWGKKRNVRILEVGAGTGGTTSAVAPQLPPHQTEYWFTDVSEGFLRRARRNFEQLPFVRYALFNLDREPEEQQLPVGYFDVVVAANVVHASRDLHASLSRIRRLLAPGGVLVLIETTVHQTCFDMSIGLIEGWQHFEDKERGEHPLLSAERWRAFLMENGFEDATALPAKDSSAFHVGQHVVLAQRDFGSGPESMRSAAGQHKASNGSEAQSRTGHAMVAAELAELPESMRADLVHSLVRQTICRVCNLEISPEDLGDRDRLSDLGMDSLIALELRSELGKALGLEGKISATVAFDTGTVGELAQRMMALIVPEKATPSAGDVSSNGVALDSKIIGVEALQNLTDAEVAELLKERMGER